ncbi:energy transducer TonB, partial [bacterium]|nr:energy transducer TonB [bacterium]
PFGGILRDEVKLLGYQYRQICALSLAFLVHGAFLWVSIPNLNVASTVLKLKDRAIEIISPDDLNIPRKPVVETSRVEKDSPSDKTAQFSGEFQQRVEQETQSPVKGAFREGQAFQAEETLEGEGEREGKSLKNLLTFGQSPNSLSKDIPFGNQTVLNTDKVRYASFINRIADEIYQPWVEEAEKALKEFTIGRRKVEPNIYITRLRVTLNSDGEVTGIQVMDSCGVSELDEAPKKAFWESEPFPNPPNQLVEKDGFVRLTYEFQFEWKNSGFNIIPWKI